MTQPTLKPGNPCFSSGPCAKRPSWNLDALKNAALGRSHRAKIGKAKLAEVIDRTRSVLSIPEDYKIGIVPASDTGAFEMAMWSLLGERGVDLFAWESFGSGWVSDVVKQLKLQDVNKYEADYGQLPDLSKADFSRDVVFTYNGTTSGVKVPGTDWIDDGREGLTLCDATSAVFAMDVDFSKLDVTTWSWQKVMGGEAAHGMIVLSPQAVKRLESYTPAWPMPKIFLLTKGGKLIDGIFKGETINTPSMLAVEDAIDGLKWAESIGGLPKLIERSDENLKVVKDWVAKTAWVDFLARSEEITSNTSICLKIVDPEYTSLPAEEQESRAKQIVSTLEKEGIAYDIGSYRDAPAGIRIWGGATVEKADMEDLLPWLDWAYAEVKGKAKAA
ncbi:MAG: phosphoserine transaminase [Alphaproteobacteria bacterium CG11_big_fil_rev_8_21_14_0_20_39_49]|nr:MAG: phosphoserine transaminase [Alphaproteobacteria bacterium CG11_big_fil_rev_8_21_14_0_20_39_49]